MVVDDKSVSGGGRDEGSGRCVAMPNEGKPSPQKCLGKGVSAF